MKLLKNIFILLVVLGLAGYGAMKYFFPNGFNATEEEEELARKKLLTIGVPNNSAALPIFVAEADSIFDSLRVSIDVKIIQNQLESDKKFANGELDIIIADPLRAQLLAESKKVKYEVLDTLPLNYAMVANPKARVKKVAQLKDKMLAVTRQSKFYETAYFAIDSVKLKRDSVYVVQINDPAIALHMLQVNTMDAAMLPEPYLSMAKRMGCDIFVNRQADFLLIKQKKLNKDEKRLEAAERHLELFAQAYREAKERIRKDTTAKYQQLLQKRCKYSLTE